MAGTNPAPSAAASPAPNIVLPTDPYDPAGLSIPAETRAILEDFNLLPQPGEVAKASGFKAAFSGGPASVAVIESTATALSKWWAGGIGASVGVAWTAVSAFWLANTDIHNSVVWGLSIITAAAFLAIAFVVNADIRGRAAGTVATIQARVNVLDAVSRLVQSGIEHAPGPSPTATSDTVAIIPLMSLDARNVSARGQDELHWKAIAARTDGVTVTGYLLVKGDRSVWLDAGDVELG